jgi:hypothetical protein
MEEKEQYEFELVTEDPSDKVHVIDKDEFLCWDGYTKELIDKGFVGECSVLREHMRTSSNLFNASCLVHDACYQRGGTEIDRMDADRGLYRRSILNAASIQNVGYMWYYITVATVWYLGVRVFGWLFFRYDGPHTKEEVLRYNRYVHSERRNTVVKNIRRFFKYYTLKIWRKYHR